jgi:protoporphyrinogen oxidase
MTTDSEMVVIGAGPAGLTTAYELARHGISGTIIEGDSVVGGLARTIERDGYGMLKRRGQDDKAVGDS